MNFESKEKVSRLRRVWNVFNTSFVDIFHILLRNSAIIFLQKPQSNLINSIYLTLNHLEIDDIISLNGASFAYI